MPKVKSDVPDKLRPYIFHGVDLSWDGNDKNAVADCPFCGKEGKFGVKIETGQWKCLVCSETGNVYTFIRLLWKESLAATNNYDDLAEDRGLSSPDTLIHWEVAKSMTTDNWIVPGFSVDGKVHNLYKYVKMGKGMTLLATPTLGHQLFGNYNSNSEVIYLCEGPWDAMMLWEILGKSKISDDSLTATSNHDKSLLGNASVLAAPGCSTFFDNWCGLFSGKIVNIIYDNDFPKKHPKTGNRVAPAGYTGTQRAAGILSTAKEPPLETNYLRWGENGYDPKLSDGMDVRDYIQLNSETVSDRRGNLEKLLSKLQPIPSEWEKTAKKKSEGGGMDCLPCNNYAEMILAWRKALRWTEGLDCALGVMLASIISTKSVGDQLWMKIIGPASCLDGDTLIHDPVDRTTLSVRERTERGDKFFVWSLMDDGEIGISQALPPEEHPKEQIYEVEFESGKKMRVTGGHRFWNGVSYVALHTIFDELSEFSSYHLPTILESDLLARGKDVVHSSQIAQDSQSDCCAYSCPCDGQPHENLNTVLDVVPSLTDAPEYNSEMSDVDDLQGIERKYNRRIEQFSRLSNFHVLPLALWPRCGDGYLLSLFANTYVWLSNLFSSIGNILRRNSRLRMSQPACLYDSCSKENDDHQHSSVLKGTLPRMIEHNQNDQHKFSENVRSCTSPQDQQFVPQLELNEVSSSSVSIKKVHTKLGRLTLTDSVINVKPIYTDNYYDFHVPETQNYWAEGFFHHNSGKSTLCEALSINRKYVYPKDTFTGLTSGYQMDNEGSENLSMVDRLNGMTLLINDGDTLLQLPNLGQVLSQLRAFYGRNLRSQFKNKMSKDHEGVSTTIILCGTNSLNKLDSSELGERFLDCVVMDGIDDDLEDAILWRVANKADKEMLLETNEDAASRYTPELALAMQLTGGYVTYLRENAMDLLSSIENQEWARRKCMRLGKFVAYMRARPSQQQEETAEREFAARLVSLHIRLSKCLAAVMNRSTVDEQVMRRVTKVALNTSRGQTLDIVKHLYEADNGLEAKSLALYTSRTEEKVRVMLRFLKAIGAVKLFNPKAAEGVKKRPRWKLTDRLRDLYSDVVEGYEEEDMS